MDVNYSYRHRPFSNYNSVMFNTGGALMSYGNYKLCDIVSTATYDVLYSRNVKGYISLFSALVFIRLLNIMINAINALENSDCMIFLYMEDQDEKTY